MFRRLSLGLIPAIAVLFLGQVANAGPIPAEIIAKIKQVYPTGLITGQFREKPDILEVFVRVAGLGPAGGPGAPIEMVFKRKAGHWHLIGYEFSVNTDQTAPLAVLAIMAKYHLDGQGQPLQAGKPSWVELELYFDAKWEFKCYVIRLSNGKEDFILPSGQWTTDPEK
jgi:hypothetical protein